MSSNIDRLRSEMEDFYGTGAFAGFPGMFMEVSDIERASDDEIIRMAEREGYDVSNFDRYEYYKHMRGEK